MSPTANDGPSRCDPVRRSMRRTIHGPDTGACVLKVSRYALSVAGSITWPAIRSAAVSRSRRRSGHGAGLAVRWSGGETRAPTDAGADLAGSCPGPAAAVVLEQAAATDTDVAIAIIASRPATCTALQHRAAQSTLAYSDAAKVACVGQN